MSKPAGSGGLPPKAYDPLMAAAFANAPDLVDVLEARLAEDLPTRARRVMREVLGAPAHVEQLRALLPELEAEHELGDLCAPAMARDLGALATAIEAVGDALGGLSYDAPAAELRGRLVTVLDAVHRAAAAATPLRTGVAAMLPSDEDERSAAVRVWDLLDEIETPLDELAQLLYAMIGR